jgi:4-hydroxy-2-oxoheptanedioate aldolase
MRPNHTKRLTQQGAAAIGTLCASASPLMAEAVGLAGFDFALVDLQHGEGTLAALPSLLHAIATTPATPLVRLPVGGAGQIPQVLDLGAYGVVVPQVHTAAEAAAVVRAVRYPPAGERSWGPTYGSLYRGLDYYSASGDELLTLVGIQTSDGVANLGAILGVPGVDGCFVDPIDLCLSLGFPPQDALPAGAEVAVAEILASTRAAGKVAGIHVLSVEDVPRRAAEGFGLIALSSDIRMVRSTAAGVWDAIDRRCADAPREVSTDHAALAADWRRRDLRVRG